MVDSFNKYTRAGAELTECSFYLNDTFSCILLEKKKKVNKNLPNTVSSTSVSWTPNTFSARHVITPSSSNRI